MSQQSTSVPAKQEVLNIIAEYAFDGTFQERKDDIPYEMVPGPKPTERCCIYKEREIIRQRIKLAEGIPSTGVVYGKHNYNVIQVIFSACADCPISSYTVTENCQNCIEKPCLDACHFGAISAGRYHSYIDTSACKECGMCAKACPYNAIAYLRRPCQLSCPVNAITYEENGISVIDKDKCIRCGKCIVGCPFDAIDTLSDLVAVIEAIKDSSRKVYLMAAPAVEGQYGDDITIASWKKAAKEMGFEDFVEVALGADLVAAAEADEWAEAYKEGKKMTTSCCPAFVNMIRRHYPEVVDNISTTISPMCATSRLIKAADPDAITVFLGPCVAKKSEAHEFDIDGNADYVLTFNEIEAIMHAKGVKLEVVEEGYQEGSIYGKNFGISGGVTAAAVHSLEEIGKPFDARVNICNGADECKLALALLQHGRLTSDFIEGMVCEEGCIQGPKHKLDAKKVRKNRDAIFDKTDDRGVRDTVSKCDMDKFSMHR